MSQLLPTMSLAQRCWMSVRNDWFDSDEFKIIFIGTYIVSLGVYLTNSILLFLLDYTGKPAFLAKYKVQENVKFDVVKFRNALPTCFFNMTVVGGTMGYLARDLWRWRGISFTPELPSFFESLCRISGYVLMVEIGFYYSHRLLHSSFLYRRVHKIHHEWTAPVAAIATYCHPIEMAVGNIGPLLLGPLVFGGHITTIWVWYAVALFETTIKHSGYHFPLGPSPEFHDFHHLKFTGNYGVTGWLDAFHGTDSVFKKAEQSKHHKMLKSLTPAKIYFASTEDGKSK